jgi:cytochrome c-type biogenesis protein CcmH
MMLLWISLSALTAGVVGALLWTYRRADVEAGDAARADVAVYADQLAQIESDHARGLLSEAEAASARAEVARRLLSRKVAGGGAGVPVAPSRMSDRLTATVLLGIPVLAVALYAGLGSPDLPDQPRSGRSPQEAARTQVEAMVARVEQRLREAPEDGTGWDVIAPIYLRLGRYGQAAEAYANANRLLGETPARLAGFAQAEILANNGIVNPNARAAAERLLAAEPGRLDARLWLTLGLEQDGKFDAALADYKALLAAPGMTDEMKAAIEQRIAFVERLARGETVAPPARPGPGDGAAPQAPADQQAMIEGMVARLAARLEADGRDPAGWAQLMRSYMVLGRPEAAAKALAAARAALKDDAAALKSVNDAAAELGVAGGREPEVEKK